MCKIDVFHFGIEVPFFKHPVSHPKTWDRHPGLKKNLDPGCPIISGRRVSPEMAGLCISHLPEIDISPNYPQNKSIV